MKSEKMQIHLLGKNLLVANVRFVIHNSIPASIEDHYKSDEVKSNEVKSNEVKSGKVKVIMPPTISPLRFYGNSLKDYSPGQYFRAIAAQNVSRQSCKVPAELHQERSCENWRNVSMFYTLANENEPIPKGTVFVPFETYNTFHEVVVQDDCRRHQRRITRFELLSATRVPDVEPKLGRKKKILGFHRRLDLYAPNKMKKPDEFPRVKPFKMGFFNNARYIEVGKPFWYSFNWNQRRPFHDRYIEIHVSGHNDVMRMLSVLDQLDQFKKRRIFCRRRPQNRRWPTVISKSVLTQMGRNC